MYLMRPATADDIPHVRNVILARSAWMESRGFPSWRDDADELAEQARNEHGTYMWVMQSETSGRIVGSTCIQQTAPPWGWTQEEFAEPADYLYTTVTDPQMRQARPGTLIAWWAVDRAARQGKTWVRRGCLFKGLVGYYETQGFAVCHEVQRTHRLVYLMARRAEMLPSIAGLVRGDE